MILVVDSGMGNVGSMANMIRKAGGDALISSDPADLARADKVVLPGVGAFDEGVSSLRGKGWWDPLTRRVLQDGVPFLGVCLGMQLITRSSEEGRLPGLGWLAARTVRFAAEAGRKVPHMGWNEVRVERESPLFRGMGPDISFYFVHSYRLACDDPADVLATTEYGLRFPACVQRGRIYATQFHPEKSHRYGLALMRNFVERG